MSIPQFPTTLPGSFWAITTFFNPVGYKNKKENYLKFRQSSKKQGLNLVAVELAFNNAPFELTKDDAEILIQVRSNSIMWQKERLLNIGFEHLPKDCDKVAWIDADIIFQSNNWISEAAKLLEKYNVVQLFSHFASLPKEGGNLWEMNLGMGNGKFTLGTAYNFAKFGKKIFFANDYLLMGRPGGAWAGRREIIEKTGFFDKSVFGSNDTIQDFSFLDPEMCSREFFSEGLDSTQERWAKKSHCIVKGSCFYLDGICFHLWHGSISKRGYGSRREEIAKKANFDPEKDLKLNKDGCYEWNSNKPLFHKALEDYFFQRDEEGDDHVVVQFPQFPTTLPGSFWAITTFFNPVGYKNKKENYLKFRQSSKKQGLNLVAVELAFNNAPFELTKDDAEILIQVRSNSIMWQKERLLNIGFEHLPKDCDKVAWIDADIIFQSNNWISEAAKLLERYVAVQLFSQFVYLDKNSKSYLNFKGFAKSVIEDTANLISGKLYTPGGAWAARRSELEKFLFFDKTPVGFGDDIMARAFFGNKNNIDKEKCPQKMRNEQDKWAEKAFAAVRCSVSFINNTACHIWHGEIADRQYQVRATILKKFDFDPNLDLKLNSDDCFEWASGKKFFHYKVKKYFALRKETV